MTESSPLGKCPECEEAIPSHRLLVEYEKDNGGTGVWAECPVCTDVVEPE